LTGSISIGRRSWYLKTSAETSDHELTQIDSPLILPAGKVTLGEIPLGLMQTSLRSRLSRKPHGRHIRDEKKEMRHGNFPLDGSSYQIGDAAITPATPMTYSTREPTRTHATHTTRNTQE
jgi:hypothetical protein